MDNIKASIKHIRRGIALKLVAETDSSVQLAKIFLRQNGYNLEENEIMRIYKYLEGKGLIELCGLDNNSLDISRVIAKITPKGTDVLERTEKISGIELEH